MYVYLINKSRIESESLHFLMHDSSTLWAQSMGEQATNQPIGKTSLRRRFGSKDDTFPKPD